MILPFLTSSMALPGKKIALQPSPNSPFAQAFAGSTRQTNAATILKPELVRVLPPSIAQDWSHAATFSCKQNSHISEARTIACLMIPPPATPYRSHNPWPVLWQHLETDYVDSLVLHGPASRYGLDRR